MKTATIVKLPLLLMVIILITGFIPASHTSIGKINFESKALLENLQAVLAELKKAKPSSAKGVYIRKITVSTTMGPGVPVEISSLSV